MKKKKNLWYKINYYSWFSNFILVLNIIGKKKKNQFNFGIKLTTSVELTTLFKKPIAYIYDSLQRRKKTLIYAYTYTTQQLKLPNSAKKLTSGIELVELS